MSSGNKATATVWVMSSWTFVKNPVRAPFSRIGDAGRREYLPCDRLTFVAAHALIRLALAETCPDRSAKTLWFIADSFG